MRRVAQPAQVAFIDHAAPIGDHQRAALRDKRAQLGGEVLAQHVEHRRDDELIARQIGLPVHQIDRHAVFGKATIMAQQLLLIAHPGVARALRVLQRPAVLPVEDEGRLLLLLRPGDAGEVAKRLPDLHRLLKDAVVLAPVVADDRAMELLGRTAALPPLEVEHGVGAVRDGLQARKQAHARLFYLADRLPVRVARRALHQPERLTLHRIEQIVHHRGVKRRVLERFSGLVPGGIAVPAGEVELARHVEVVDEGIHVHHVRADLCLRHDLADAVALPLHEVDGLVGDEAPPVEVQAVGAVFAVGRGAFDLVKVRKFMGPELGVPGAVERGIARRSCAETAAKVEAVGGTFFEVLTDLSAPDASKTVANACKKLTGRVDILVNNAGIIHREDAVNVTEASWDLVTNLNEKLVFFLSQAMANEFFIPQGCGKIINIASMLSFQGGIRVPSYTASKSAVMGLTKALANEWASLNINVNAIAPGYMATNNTTALRQDSDRNDAILCRIPAGRWGTSDDLIGAAVFLASDASSYVNGFTLAVDGGWLAR